MVQNICALVASFEGKWLFSTQYFLPICLEPHHFTILNEQSHPAKHTHMPSWRGTWTLPLCLFARVVLMGGKTKTCRVTDPPPKRKKKNRCLEVSQEPKFNSLQTPGKPRWTTRVSPGWVGQIPMFVLVEGWFPCLPCKNRRNGTGKGGSKDIHLRM